jgi:pimeloyl-ACP methyl ester carboxylesterase
MASRSAGVRLPTASRTANSCIAATTSRASRTSRRSSELTVAALVYIASFNLEVSESTAELAAKFPGGELGSALKPVPFPTPDGGTGTDLYIQQDKFREVFAADVAPDVAELMAATQRPIAASALEDIATKAARKTIPSWTMVTTQDLAIPPDSMRYMAERAESTTVEIDASHAVTVSKPGAVADLIHKAARATTP